MRSINRQITGALALIICLAACAELARADVKVRAKSTQGNTTSEQTTYIKGQRQRLEMAGGVMISITQCDLQRTLQIIPQTKTYTITPFNPAGERNTSPTPDNQPKAKAGADAKGGVVTTTITSKDTGERKPMFGYTARRIITEMRTESSPDACQKVQTRMEIDAWYIDAAFALDCSINGGYQGYNRADQRGCQDRFEVKQVGAAAKGYPVWTKTTLFDDNGQPSFSYLLEVIEFTQGPLDAALFDVPAGYREVKDLSQAMSVGRDDAPTRTPATENSAMNANVKAKDQLTLDIHLHAPSSTVAITEKQFKAKAQSSGEDIISPALQQAAQTILEATKA